MSMIGYQQLMKDILDLDKTSIEMLLEKVGKHRLSPLRLAALKCLAQSGRETVSGLLRNSRAYNTGGTYKGVSSFFLALSREGILSSTKVGNRTYWVFDEQAMDLENYFKLSKKSDG